MAVATEQVASKEMDVLPGHGRYLLQQPDRFLVVGGLVALEQGREQDAVVGDDDVGDQPAALVGDRDVKVGRADQLLLTAVSASASAAPPPRPCRLPGRNS
jgi:hypothetical protein